MKKIIICLMAAILSLTILPVQSFASTKEVHTSLVAKKPAETKGISRS